MAGAESKNAKDLTAVMEATMQQLQSRFQDVSNKIISRLDEMGTRIDDMEKDVADLMTQAGMEDHRKSNGFEKRTRGPKH